MMVLSRKLGFIILTYVSQAAAAATPSDSISSIREKYVAIENRKDLSEEKFKIACESDISGAHVELFQEKDKVFKAVIRTFLPGESGSDRYSFYFSEGQPIFALHATEGYATLDRDPLLKTTEKRYYVDNGKVIQCLKKTATAKSKDMSAALDKAANKAGDCSQAAKALEIAGMVAQGKAGMDKVKPLLFGKCAN